MKLLVYGSKGWIGSQFCKYMEDNGVEYIAGVVRVDNTTSLIEELKRIGPTHVLITIGRTGGVINGELINTIDYLEKPGKLVENIRDNLFSPLTLSILSRELNFHLTYLGTGCIFNSSPDTQFKESDEPNFFGSSYSIVKGYTDRLMHLFGDSVLNLRIRMPITRGHHPKNFITKITSYPQICSMPNSMTVLRDFYPLFLEWIQTSRTGTVNCTNPGIISHNEILSMYKEYVDPHFTWKNFTIEEQDAILASKRSNNHLDTGTIEKYNVPSIKNSIQNLLQNWSV